MRPVKKVVGGDGLFHTPPMWYPVVLVAPNEPRLESSPCVDLSSRIWAGPVICCSQYNAIEVALGPSPTGSGSFPFCNARSLELPWRVWWDPVEKFSGLRERKRSLAILHSCRSQTPANPLHPGVIATKAAEEPPSWSQATQSHKQMRHWQMFRYPSRYGSCRQNQVEMKGWFLVPVLSRWV